MNGMYYVDSFKNTNNNLKINRWYVVYDPNHYVVKPIFDYIRYQYSMGKTDNDLSKVANSLAHYYNYLRLYKMTGEEKLTSEILNNYVEYLASIPKNLKNRMKNYLSNEKVELSDVNYLPVHPYIYDGKFMVEILKDWYDDFWLGSDDIVLLPSVQNVHFREDREEWQYSYSYIRKCVNETLSFLKYLSETEQWKHRFKTIEEKVARLERRYNPYLKKFYLVWDVEGRIKNETKLKEIPKQRQKKRIFFEDELRCFLNSSMLKKHQQRKLYFLLLILSGARISEVLNMLLDNVEVSFPKKTFVLTDLKERAVIHWEDMFSTHHHHSSDKNDLYINQKLEFCIKIVKRPLYEAKGRKNKTLKSRFIILKDCFELPKILDLELSNIFIEPRDIIKCFYKDILLNDMEKKPWDFVEMVMDRHLEEIRKGYTIEDSEYDYQVKDWVFRLRQLIEDSWFGNLLKDYLIERELMMKELKVSGGWTAQSINQNYLFIGFRNNKGKPLFPNTIREQWFKKICDQERIIRYKSVGDEIFKHSRKPDLTVHSFRHTYISMRINLESMEGEFSKVNLANLKKDVGHIPSSTVTETIYYFADDKKNQKVYTKIFESLVSNIDNTVFIEENQT